MGLRPPHAEVEALDAAEKVGFKNFSQSTLYVSLEPCCHTRKRTPPCAQYLIQKKIGSVVVAMTDPHPAVSGKGIRLLKAAGVTVTQGVLKQEALQLNQAFIKNQVYRLPYVTLKLASTFDGRLADDFGKSQWITSDAAREDTHKLRATVDAIAVGARTLDQDNPQLNIRISKQGSKAQRVVVFGRPQTPRSKLKAIRANGDENVFVLSHKKPLKSHLKSLFKDQGICHLLVEGGSQLASQFVSAGLVDRMIIYYGRGLAGGQGKYLSFKEKRSRPLAKIIKFQPERVTLLTPDIKVEGQMNVYGID